MATLSPATNLLLLYLLHHRGQPTLASFLPKMCRIGPRQSIFSVHAVEPAKTLVVTNKPKKRDTTPAPSRRWAVDRCKAKKAPQLSEYLDEKELSEVQRMIESFPPIVFAEEAFLHQGGDCAESFKEFNANK